MSLSLEFFCNIFFDNHDPILENNEKLFLLDIRRIIGTGIIKIE